MFKKFIRIFIPNSYLSVVTPETSGGYKEVCGRKKDFVNSGRVGLLCGCVFMIFGASHSLAGAAEDYKKMPRSFTFQCGNIENACSAGGHMGQRNCVAYKGPINWGAEEGFPYTVYYKGALGIGCDTIKCQKKKFKKCNKDFSKSGVGYCCYKFS